MEEYDDLDPARPQARDAAKPLSLLQALPFAEVSVQGGRGGDRLATLTYEIPPNLRGRVGTGQLIWAPLRQKLTLGVIVGTHDEVPSFTARPIHAPVEPEFRLSPSQLALAEWMAERYCCTFFEAALPLLPPGASRRSVVHLAATGAPPPLSGLSPKARRLLGLLEERGETSLAAVQEALGSSLATVVQTLERLGLVERIARVVHDIPQAREERWVRPLPAALGPDDPATLAGPRAPKQAAVLDLLRRQARMGGERRSSGQRVAESASPGDTPAAPMPLSDVYRLTGANRTILRGLEDKGLIEVYGAPGLHEPASLRPSRYEAPPPLTPPQSRVWEPLSAAITAGQFAPFLLHGVTGSGKTEIYLRAAAATIRAGRQALILVPEIALTSQIVARFANRFPGKVAILHSSLRDAERYAQWELVRTGERPIIIGPRSALFAPVPDLGLIVIDEEHESAYKQSSPDPRYDARAVAEELAHLSGATIVLGSATPDIGTRWRAESGQIGLLELHGRVGPVLGGVSGAVPLDLPAVEPVDMRQELRSGHTGIFSRALVILLRDTFAAGEQSILFLNRRGMSTFVQCRACGTVYSCPRCDIPLVYHADREHLLCHRCNGREPRPRQCHTCGSTDISYFGVGTQRVEKEVRALLPKARVLRWDQDAITAKVDAASLLAKVQAHEVDIVVGTQMVAKGLDLPLVTSIGVINADTLLNLPDFRAGERTFQLLTQVAGRAGRRGPGGRVIVQSYTPEHYAIQAALGHDYTDFYREELDFRRRHRYPPFSRLARFVFRHADEAICAREGEALSRAVALAAQHAGLDDLDIMGPTPCFAAKMRDLYQWQLIIRSGDLDAVLRHIRVPPAWTIDVDPVSML
jgi:primosomal protein N' (replication factor Y) (superfamily II helicase)